MKEKEIKFKHDYYKLYKPSFTTIRSKSYLKNKGLNVGDIVKITHPSGSFTAKIVGVEVKRICDIPLEVLKEDGEFPGFEIRTHQDFVDLLNSFIPFKSNRLTTEKAIIYLEKVE